MSENGRKVAQQIVEQLLKELQELFDEAVGKVR
jgi:hypothetical protein